MLVGSGSCNKDRQRINYHKPSCFNKNKFDCVQNRNAIKYNTISSKISYIIYTTKMGDLSDIL